MSRAAQAVERAVREMREQSRREAARTARKGARMMDDDFDNGIGNDGGIGDESLDQLLSGDPEMGALHSGTETTEAEGADDMAKRKKAAAGGRKKAAAKPRAAKAVRQPKAPRAAGPRATAKLEDDGQKTLFVSMPRTLLAKALKAAADADRFTEAEAEQAKKILQRIAAN